MNLAAADQIAKAVLYERSMVYLRPGAHQTNEYLLN